MLNKNTINQLTTLRKSIHAQPEISGEEYETQQKIILYLEQNTTAKISKVANTGVIATFSATTIGPTVLIRGDIDALPIEEVNDFEHRSTKVGVSHKCGHDGHTCILLGLAVLLSQEPLTKGEAILLFQPAEENGMGAEAVLKDPLFSQLTIDYAFALHNLPGYPLHEVVIKEHEFTANVKSIIIQLKGKTAHASEPEKGVNPSLALAELLLYAEKITLNAPEKSDFFLVTPIYLNMGDLAYGISAGYGEVHFTIRSWSTALMEEKSTELVNFINQLCKKHHLEPIVSWTQVFAANINDPEAVTVIKKAAHENQYQLTERPYPFKWGEDFGLFTQRIKGAMFGIGAGVDLPALHNPDYDFPDELIPTGANMFYQIIKKIT